MVPPSLWFSPCCGSPPVVLPCWFPPRCGCPLAAGSKLVAACLIKVSPHPIMFPSVSAHSHPASLLPPLLFHCRLLDRTAWFFIFYCTGWVLSPTALPDFYLIPHCWFLSQSALPCFYLITRCLVFFLSHTALPSSYYIPRWLFNILHLPHSSSTPTPSLLPLPHPDSSFLFLISPPFHPTPTKPLKQPTLHPQR